MYTDAIRKYVRSVIHTHRHEPRDQLPTAVYTDLRQAGYLVEAVSWDSPPTGWERSLRIVIADRVFFFDFGGV